MSNRKLSIWSLLFMLFLPLIFQGPHDEFSVARYLVKCMMPLMMLVIFWLNYQWLIPSSLRNNNIRKLILVNVVLIACICVALNIWHNFELSFFRQSQQFVHSAGSAAFHGHRHPLPHEMPHMHDDFFIFAFVRDSITTLLPIFVAYTIRMSQHVTLLRQQQQESEVARRDAELRGLRNQISPHFLLNTLNNIYALAAISAERTQGAVMQLSQMLRHMLYDNQDEFVTLSSEANFIVSYIELMRLRLSSNVTVETHITVSPESKTLVAPLLFISLVENAFKHGVSASAPCHIAITLEEDPDHIHCLLRNSNHPKKSTDRSGHGIGLQNVQQRLDMMYPEQYVWHKGVKNDDYFSEITINKK